MKIEYDAPAALSLLRAGSAEPTATFREGQEEAIRDLVQGQRLLVVQKTGWGKSFVYFITAKLLRNAGAGPTLLISPLLALMRNQIAAAERMGLRAMTVNSENTDDWRAVEAAARRDELDILLISPERLDNERFVSRVMSVISARIALLVVDEAHCISDWGHDFRPHYRLLDRIVRTLPANMRLLATTATANARVMEDLSAVLGPKLKTLRGDLDRPSLTLQTLRLSSQAQRLAWLAEQVPRLPGSGIIYTLTIRDAELVAGWLRSRGLNVHAYTSATGDARPGLEQDLLDNRVKALVATPALGMGFDKPDLAFVIHYQAPGSVVSYYQQVGRAGRALTHARGVLLSGAEEQDIQNFFITSAFPTHDEVEKVLEALHDAPEGLSVHEMLGRVNVSEGRITKTLDLLKLQSPAPIVKQGATWQLTPVSLQDEFWARAQRLTELRRSERAQMQEYVNLDAGHMEFLIRALDGTPGPSRAPSLPPLPATVDVGLLREAEAYLRQTELPIEPRRQWPGVGLPSYGLRGRIKPHEQMEAGRALCMWAGAGWGELVRRGKSAGRFDDALVAACVELMRRWSPQPAPVWVTCIPSLRHVELVPRFAHRLAAGLGLPFVAALKKTDQRPEQKTMANSAQQARNVDGSLAMTDEALPEGPVLLVDDIVDSRWTLTVATWLLRSRTGDKVFPLALASMGPEQ